MGLKPAQRHVLSGTAFEQKRKLPARAAGHWYAILSG